MTYLKGNYCYEIGRKEPVECQAYVSFEQREEHGVQNHTAFGVVGPK